MGTSLEYFSPEYLVPWGNDDMRLRILEYVRAVQEAELYMQFGPLPLQVDTLAELTVDGGADAAISVANSNLRAVVPRAYGRLRALTYSGTDQVFASNVFAGLPYEAAAGITYHVGLRWCAYPTESRLSDSGAYELVRWKEGIGESGQPLSVTDNGDGTLTFLLATAAQGGVGPLGGRPWSADNGGNRYVRVWLADPVTGYIEASGSPVGQAVHCTATNSDGAIVTVTVAHTFGQGSSPSTNAADYQVVVHGPSIWRATDRNLLAYTYGSPAFRPYVFLGAVTDGAADTSAAPSSPSLGIVRNDLLQLAADLYDAPHLDGDGNPNLTLPLQALARLASYRFTRGAILGWRTPCAHFGTIAASKAWIDALSQTPVSGAIRFALGAWPASGWALVSEPSDSVPYFVSAWKSNGERVDFDTGSASGDYVIAMEAVFVSTAPGSEDVRAELIVFGLADLGSHARHLPIATFHWDGASVSSLVISDLGRDYRPGMERAADRTFRDSAGNVVSVGVLDNTRPELRSRIYPVGVAVNPSDLTRVWTKTWMPDAATRRFELTGIGGEEDGAGSGNLAPGYKLEIGLGGADDLLIRAIDTKVTGLKRGTGTAKFEYYKDGGGQDSADADGQKPYWKLGDVKLLGTKTIDEAIPLEAAVVEGGAWSAGAVEVAIYTITNSAAVRFGVRHRLVGWKLLGFRVRAALVGGTGGDALVGTIYKVDSSAGTLPLSEALQTLAGGGAPTSVEWTSATLTTKDVLLPAGVNGSATDRYFLRLYVSDADESATSAHVAQVLAVYVATEL